ncbi:VOC family protein [Sutcliffiella sp. NPDC057660]|uniref:VOC family protein n=1 Tax=Sutcliffiella sp. NPDC057660 TaxID=3346199 RepID=UPI0036B565CE
MIFEMTYQVRVQDMKDGQLWYEILLNKQPDFTPHEGFSEWELIPGCWLQVAEGIPSEGSGPLRLGVTDLEAERTRLIHRLHVEEFDIHSREEVPVKWATFSDPWGNRIGLFEYMDKEVERERVYSVLGLKEGV